MEQQVLFDEIDINGTTAVDFGRYTQRVNGCGVEFFPCPYQVWKNKYKLRQLPSCNHSGECFDTWRLTPEYRFPDGFEAEANGYIDTRVMDDGRYWCLLNLTLGRLRIVIAEDQFTAGEHWCFPEGDEGRVAAIRSYMLGPSYPPRGWSRHMHPDGTMEYPNDRPPS
jgi:hypothetical protein